MKILLVDDDQMVRECLTDVLRDVIGCQVLAADSAETALSLAAAGETFDLLLTDLQMTGMSGADLVAKLRELGYVQPMYVLTGLVSLKSVPGATGVLHKPPWLETLEGIVKAHS